MTTRVPTRNSLPKRNSGPSHQYDATMIEKGAIASAVGFLLAVAMVLLGAGEVSAEPPTGSYDQVESRTDGVVTVRGWVFDRSDLGKRVAIHAYLGGEAGQDGVHGYDLGSDGRHRPDVGRVHAGVGDYRGFEFSFTTDRTGRQPVCLYAINLGAGGNNFLGCKSLTFPETTDLGLRLTPIPSQGQGCESVQKVGFQVRSVEGAIDPTVSFSFHLPVGAHVGGRVIWSYAGPEPGRTSAVAWTGSITHGATGTTKNAHALLLWQPDHDTEYFKVPRWSLPDQGGSVSVKLWARTSIIYEVPDGATVAGHVELSIIDPLCGAEQCRDAGGAVSFERTLIGGVSYSGCYAAPDGVDCNEDIHDQLKLGLGLASKRGNPRGLANRWIRNAAAKRLELINPDPSEIKKVATGAGETLCRVGHLIDAL